jgi:hypothetical protein
LGRTAEQALLREEQLLSVELHTMRDTEADLASCAGASTGPGVSAQ